MILNQVNMPQLLNLQVVLRDRLHPPLAALANAISQAVGVRMDRLPMSPGAILEALQRKQTHPSPKELHHG